jgi:hypothetical protein
MLSIQRRRLCPIAKREASQTLKRVGAGIIDPDAFNKAWNESMPADTFTTETRKG